MLKFRIIELLLENPKLSQKRIAEQMGVSIGKVNYVINRLALDGYLQVEKKEKRFTYTVTEKAKMFILSEIDEFQQTKIMLHSNEQKKVKQAVILAAGSKNEFEGPVCLEVLEDGVTILDRTIHLLMNNGIEKIVIVSGYKKERFQQVKLPNCVSFIENEKYKWTGSMASLAMVKDVIDDDFLLIEDDIVIEELAISNLLNYSARDCMLVVNESGSNDEAYIEVKNGYLYKISKDIHQLNRIDGEMLGISKISKSVFDEMLTQFSFNKNPYMNYEYMILDVSRSIDIGFLKINDVAWADVDTKQQYVQMVNEVYPQVRQKEERKKSVEVIKEVVNALGVEQQKISNIRAFGGMTNINYSATIDGAEYVVRMPGVGTEEFINRSEEQQNLVLATQLGINPETTYFNVETGLKITKMIPNAETLTIRMTKNEEIMKMVTATLRKLHQSDMKMGNQFELFALMELYETNIVNAEAEFFTGFEEVKKEVYDIKAFFETLSIDFAPTHIDALFQNFIKSGDDAMYLIDWEYSGMFDPLWDVATHTLESDFSVSEEELFFTHYFQRPITDSEKRRIVIHKIFQDYLWTMWTIFKEAKGDDFGTYGMDRYERMKVNLTQYKKLYKGVLS